VTRAFIIKHRMRAFLEFFKRQLLVAHVWGIPVRIDYRWFPVFLLVAWLMAGGVPAGLVDSFEVRGALGVITALIFFVSIFLHELAHAFAARMERVEVIEIVLHPFGGLSRMRREPDNPRAEFRIAVAGPVASFALALVFLGFTVGSNSAGTVVLSPLFFLLFFGNLLLAVFNLFPGYPLDGGRILRAFLWKRGRELNEATVMTGKAGQIIGIALTVFGLFITVVRADFFTGLWTVMVGLFLYDAARTVIKQVTALENLRVESVMTLPVSVAPDSLVSQFVDRVLPLHRRTVFLVAQNKELYGVLTLEDLKAVPREKWGTKKIVEVMRPITTDYFVETDTLFVDAKEQMRSNGIGAVGVINGEGNLVGFLQSGRIRKS
jgi:Zn-dependent protease